MTPYLDRLKAMIHENEPPDQPPKPPKPPQTDPAMGFGGFGGSFGGDIPEPREPISYYGLLRSRATGLPDEVFHGVTRLQRMQPVGHLPRDAWRTYAADALALVESGIAAAALQQGWSAVDLFGVSRDESWQCLAAWIGGRRDDHGRACYLLTEIRGERTLPYAVQAAGASRRWHYPEPAPSDAVLPWSM